MARPVGISKDLLNKCAKAFSENRGKTETEIEAVYQVLKKGLENEIQKEGFQTSRSAK